MKKNDFLKKKNEKNNKIVYLNDLCSYLHHSFFLFLHDNLKKE